MQLSQTENTLLILLRKALFHSVESLPSLSEADLHALLVEAMQQAVPTLAASAMEVPANLRRSLYATTISNCRVEYGHVAISQLFTDHQIPHVLIKGCVAASYYPKPTLRTLGDVDVLVAEEDVSRAERLLEESGYFPKHAASDHHLGFRKDQVEYELHFEVPGIPYGVVGTRTRAYLEDIFQCSQSLTLDCGTIRVPSSFHHGLILLLHSAHHWVTSGIGLRHLCDWVVFYPNYSDQDFRDTFEKPLREIGLWRFAQLITQLCAAALGGPMPSWACKVEEKVLAELLEDIFAGGNFGRKDGQRNNQALLISSNGKNEVGKYGIFRQSFASLDQYVLMFWPWSKRVILARPFLWVFALLRYAVRMLAGKRKPIGPETISGATSRKKLYRQFHLFEPEGSK